MTAFVREIQATMSTTQYRVQAMEPSAPTMTPPMAVPCTRRWFFFASAKATMPRMSPASGTKNAQISEETLQPSYSAGASLRPSSEFGSSLLSPVLNQLPMVPFWPADRALRSSAVKPLLV